MARKNLAYLLAAFGGGVLGVAVGVLFAPASGAETRRRLNAKLTEEADLLRRRGRQALDELGHLASERVERGKKALAELTHH